MSAKWAHRQRRTGKLMRVLAEHSLQKPLLSPQQVYGFCMLTWISQKDDSDRVAYIRSTKIPALGDILECDYSGMTLAEVAKDVAGKVEDPSVEGLVLSHTGFTNFYNAYRNSCKKWIADHITALDNIIRMAFKADSVNDGRDIVMAIIQLPALPRANMNSGPTKPENLLTPVAFALQKQMRFPLINGNDFVQRVLTKLGVANAPLDQQYQEMVKLIGKNGIQDAADLDQLHENLIDMVTTITQDASARILQEYLVEGNPLPIKDEGDIEALQQTRTVTHRRRHNELTNALRKCLTANYLLEGISKEVMFDVLVKNYNGSKADLLIEAKSSAEPAHIRMAVGQLLHYRFSATRSTQWDLAILLPTRPDDTTVAFMTSLEIGVLWIEGGNLRTCSSHLQTLCST